MLYVYWLLKWLNISTIIYFEPYSNAGYTNQYLCSKGAWQEYLGIGQFDCLGVKLLINNPWCGSDQLSKISSTGNPCRKKIYSCPKPAMIFLFSNFLVLTNSWLENRL